MSRLSLLKLLMITLIVVSSQPGLASGGWVGNSPVQIASYNPVTYASNYTSAETTDSWNSLLLPKGASRFSTEWTQAYSRPAGSTQSTINLSYDYAFTENLTTFSLTQWGYSLLSGNGQGHEAALFFGLHGIGYSSYLGFSVAPGVGLGYAYTDGPWRVQTRLTGSSYYYQDLKSWGRLLIDWNSQLSYSISSKWWAGVGVESSFIKRDQVVDEDHDDIISARAFITPKVLVGYSANSLDINESGLDLWMSASEKEASLGASWRW